MVFSLVLLVGLFFPRTILSEEGASSMAFKNCMSTDLIIVMLKLFSQCSFVTLLLGACSPWCSVNVPTLCLPVHSAGLLQCLVFCRQSHSAEAVGVLRSDQELTESILAFSHCNLIKK